MSANIKIIYLYDEAIKAKTNGDFKKAANLFLQCHNLYQNAELSMFSKEVKQKGEDSKIHYRQISNNHLDENKFDNIIYGV
jgi:hypothetical protein